MSTNLKSSIEREKKLAEKIQLDNVVKSLDRVPIDTRQMIFSMSKGMSELEIIQSFNQQALDMFILVISITKRTGKEKEYQFTGYKALFDNAVKINNKLPLDKFTLIILEFAAEIYAEEENCFLDMSIPDKEVNVGNEFGLIRSESFKILWKTLGRTDKEALKENIILLTTYAHAFLYKTLLKN